MNADVQPGKCRTYRAGVYQTATQSRASLHKLRNWMRYEAEHVMIQITTEKVTSDQVDAMGEQLTTEKPTMSTSQIKVEPIDNHHPAWGKVLTAIFRTGDRESILLHEDGWLSSRQTILAAFDGDEVVGHLCFSVEPSRCPQGQTQLQSRVDSFSVNQAYVQHSVEQRLLSLAEARARLMRCGLPRIAMLAS